EIGFYLAWTLDPLGQALSFLVGLAVLWSIDRSMTLFVFLPLLAVLALVNTTRGRVRAYRQANQQAIGEVTGLLGELFGAAVAVKVAGAEGRGVARLSAINEARRLASLRGAGFPSFVQGISTNAANVRDGPDAAGRRRRDAARRVHGRRLRALRLLPRLARADDRLGRRLHDQVPPGRRLARAAADADAGRAAGAAGRAADAPPLARAA